MASGKKIGKKSQASNDFLEPMAPTGVTATNVGTGRAFNNGAATVTFSLPALSPAATSFTVTSSPGGYTGTGASSPITVAGLQSSTAYTFTATATNAAGTSVASSASGSITATTVPATMSAPTPTAGVNQNSIAENDYKVGDRIAKIMIIPHPPIEFKEVNDLSETERGEGGFGSTGK